MTRTEILLTLTSAAMLASAIGLYALTRHLMLAAGVPCVL